MLSMIRRNKIYSFRLRVPVYAQKYFPRTEIVRSLSTTKFRQAKSIFNCVLGDTERLFTMIRTGALDPLTIRRLVDEYKSKVLAFDPEFPPAGKGYREVLTEHYSGELEQKTEALLDYRGQDHGTMDTALYILRKAGMVDSQEYEPSTLEHISGFKELCREVALAERDIYSACLQRSTTGDSDYDKAERLKPKSHTLQEAIKGFISDSSKGQRKRVEKTAKIYECFQVVTGKQDIPLSEIDHELTRKVADRLKAYPLYRHSRYKGKSLAEIDKIPDVERSSPTTQTEELIILSSFYQFAIDRLDGLQRNFAKGLGAKLVETPKSKASEYRDILRPPDILEIVNELKRRKGNGEFEKNPHLLLIPLVALFQGMRVNEICQLRVDDINTVDGIWCISVNEECEGMSVKTASSLRVNPIHPTLIDLGLIRFWQRQKAKGCVRLWEGEAKISCALFRTNGRNTHSHYFSKWFNGTFKKRLQLSNPDKQTFHSTRHTVANWFRQNLRMAEHGEAVQAIMGHLDKDDIKALEAQGWDTKAETFVT